MLGSSSLCLTGGFFVPLHSLFPSLLTICRVLVSSLYNTAEAGVNAGVDGGVGAEVRGRDTWEKEGEMW